MQIAAINKIQLITVTSLRLLAGLYSGGGVIANEPVTRGQAKAYNLYRFALIRL
jgi:hypothetical protein